jgi:hydroxyacylglutathione hydrolase
MARQEKGLPTVPTSVGLELKTNPFVRFQQPAVRQAAINFAGKELAENWEVFAALREWKDSKYD